MDWLDWNEEAFERARAERKPVFLFVEAAWCRWCRELERRVLADERIQRVLRERFVAVRVDKDRRPDIDARYTKGGWPTLAYLDDTGEALAADNYLEADELLRRLELVSEYYATRPAEIGPRLAGERAAAREEPRPAARRSAAALGTPRAELSLEIVEQVARTVLETADPVYGGWGTQHKFPHPEALDFALIRWSQTGDAAMLELVRRTLRRMRAGAIHDAVEGGFYRYATQPDWSVPHHEKMLDSNAQRLFVYLEAYQALGEEGFRETAEGVLRWMEDTLLDRATGAFRGSQDASSPYAHAATREARLEHATPRVDPTIFSNWNAMAVSALLKADVVLGRPALGEQALRTLDFLLEELFDERWGMYHYWDGAPHLPGMLTDQAYVLRALIDAVQYRSENRFLERAEELAQLALEHLRADGGAFFDTLYDPRAAGSLRQRNRSILENSVMAEALLRLSLLVDERAFEDAAREALAAFVGDYRRYGHYVAGYARAVDLLFHAPVHVVVVGPKGDPRTRRLTLAALRPYVASRVVQTIDPELDVELHRRLHLPPTGNGPRAYVQRGRESYAETDDPVRLPGLMSRT